MTTQPEALSLADVFEEYAADHQPDGWPAIRQEVLNSAAAELRRLHAENEALRVSLEQPGVEPVEWSNEDVEALRHAANEWADMATNGLQWVRNIVEGISRSKDALENLEANLKHCREVNSHPGVQRIVRGTRTTAPQPAQQPQPVQSVVGVKPYEPTEQMRWAAKAIDPGLTHGQIRAIWASMWSAAPQPAQQKVGAE